MYLRMPSAKWQPFYSGPYMVNTQLYIHDKLILQLKGYSQIWVASFMIHSVPKVSDQDMGK